MRGALDGHVSKSIAREQYQISGARSSAMYLPSVLHSSILGFDGVVNGQPMRATQSGVSLGPRNGSSDNFNFPLMQVRAQVTLNPLDDQSYMQLLSYVIALKD